MLRSIFFRNRAMRILTLFILFHIFWIVFYILSGNAFIKQMNADYYLKLFINNSLGFVAFSIAAFWFFPNFISKKRYYLLAFVGIITIVVLGYVQFELQTWMPRIFSKPPSLEETSVNSSRKIIAASMVKPAVGAQVRAMLNVFVYLLLGIGYAYMRDWFEKDRYTRLLEKEKIQAELTLLRYQLNPHFLFNTINNIYYLAIIRSDKTADAILKVSELLRYVLDKKEDSVSLEKEVNYLEEFINLQKFRFPDQVVHFNVNVNGAINNHQIAPLLLITFVENAFKHGDPGTSDDAVTINLDFNAGALHYKVKNRINQNPKKDPTTGIGLTNLKRRLTLLYPDAHSLRINTNEGYFEAELKIHLT